MMARPIDADKLRGIYKKWIPQLSSKEDEGDRRGVETCIAVLEDMPTMDAVEVVRCKDCIHSSDVLYHTYCGYLDCVVYPHFYCAGGKRKEEKNGVCNTL